MFIDIIITSFNKYKYHSMLTSKGVIYFLGVIILLFILVDFNLLQKLKYEVDNSSKLRTSLHKMLKLLLTIVLISLVAIPPLAGHAVHNLYKHEEYFVVFAKETATDGLMVNLILLSQVNIITNAINKQWTEV